MKTKDYAKYDASYDGIYGYFNGDICIYTGRSEKLYGGAFYEVVMYEGDEKGKTKHIVRPPHPFMD